MQRYKNICKFCIKKEKMTNNSLFCGARIIGVIGIMGVIGRAEKQ
jgi:hypothetical protein